MGENQVDSCYLIKQHSCQQSKCSTRTFPAFFLCLGSLHNISSAQLKRSGLFVGTPSSHTLPANILLQGKLPGQPKLMQHTEENAYILPENCSHFQSNSTKLYFNLLLFHLIFFLDVLNTMIEKTTNSQRKVSRHKHSPCKERITNCLALVTQLY